MILTFNTLLALLFKAKKSGKGRIGKGRFYISLMRIFTGCTDSELLGYFGNDPIIASAYRKLDRYLCRFEKDGKGYPYELIPISQFRSNSSNIITLEPYLEAMKEFCDRNLDTAFILPLIHTIIESVRQDHSISKLLYGASFIDKEKLTGSFAHPSSICLEALLLGLIYHTHKCPERAIVKEIILIAAPKRHTFRIERYSDKYDLETDTHISLAASLFENSHHQDGTPLLNIPDIEFTDCNDLFKAILLRYRYQNEYSNWHDCCVCEGEKNTIQEISELKRILCSLPANGIIQYKLILSKKCILSDTLISKLKNTDIIYNTE